MPVQGTVTSPLDRPRATRPSPAASVLEAQGLRHAHGRRTVLDELSFEVAPGTLVGIVGENGSGKSTLLRILAGELRPNGGAVIRHAPLGYCPQRPVLNEALTVDQHLVYFAAAYDTLDLGYANELIARLGFFEYRATPVKALSGGTCQKLNLTLALMQRPPVLLLDEPYQGFDWETYLCFWELVGDLTREGRSIVVVSHLLFERERFDRILRLGSGRVQEDAP
jgi:ABC-2 type transport system ATP-binding protein